ncbi:zinc finger TRAF-type-containing protein 1-like [Mytilus galloprovincialis]|uniref:zinc finger TRAF-type-containing protein 1-like n=1 Tax=Mytilus galloprovincialis TaxID=29158 RepID=UPI003F7C8D02
MSDIPGPSALAIMDENSNKENMDIFYEPEKKKVKVEEKEKEKNALEYRLSGILCCAVCLDLPKTCYQCTNGHLMCAGCFNHVLADSRLKDETATCPNCRCEISKNLCSRNLAVEKAVSELPTECQYCYCHLPRNQVDYHERELCEERPSLCKYSRIGCCWCGPFHELAEHEIGCGHLMKPGAEIMESLAEVDKYNETQLKLYKDIVSLFSCEKVTFNDLQMKPYRTDDFTTKLFYETSRFSAFNFQWVIKARINNDQKNPALTTDRTLSYQLVLKSKFTTPISLSFIVLKGPYGEMKINPYIYTHDFVQDNVETAYNDLPIINSVECNKLLAGRTINLRLIMVMMN